MNGGEEGGCEFVVSCGNRPKLLEFGEEVLDEVPGFVEVFVVGRFVQAG